MSGSYEEVECCCGCQACEHRAVVMFSMVITGGEGVNIGGPEPLCVPCLLNVVVDPTKSIPDGILCNLKKGSSVVLVATPLPGVPLFSNDPRVIGHIAEKNKALSRHTNN